MPKGFTEREKELIREKLFQTGTKFFDQYGVQKTTVDEIAKEAGISKGSFYSFYDSKEELFFDILESLDKKNKEKFSCDLFPKGRSFKNSFKAFLNEIFESIENASILKRMTPSELEHLIRKLPPYKIERHLSHDNDYFEEFYETWRNKSVFKKCDPKGFTGIIKLLFYFNLHQADYSLVEFKATKELLIDMLSEYLIKE